MRVDQVFLRLRLRLRFFSFYQHGLFGCECECGLEDVIPLLGFKLSDCSKEHCSVLDKLITSRAADKIISPVCLGELSVLLVRG